MLTTFAPVQLDWLAIARSFAIIGSPFRTGIGAQVPAVGIPEGIEASSLPPLSSAPEEEPPLLELAAPEDPLPLPELPLLEPELELLDDPLPDDPVAPDDELEDPPLDVDPLPEEPPDPSEGAESQAALQIVPRSATTPTVRPARVRMRPAGPRIVPAAAWADTPLRAQ